MFWDSSQGELADDSNSLEFSQIFFKFSKGDIKVFIHVFITKEFYCALVNFWACAKEAQVSSKCAYLVLVFQSGCTGTKSSKWCGWLPLLEPLLQHTAGAPGLFLGSHPIQPGTSSGSRCVLAPGQPDSWQRC